MNIVSQYMKTAARGTSFENDKEDGKTRNKEIIVRRGEFSDLKKKLNVKDAKVKANKKKILR